MPRSPEFRPIRPDRHAFRTLLALASVRALDAHVIESTGTRGAVLMQRAGAAAASLLRSRFGSGAAVTVVCGVGNNAGDGWVVAERAHAHGADVTVVDLATRPLQGAAAEARTQAIAAGIVVAPPAALGPRLDTADVIVDALLGTGTSGAPRPPFDAAIGLMNAAAAPVLALDVPSGLDADTGGIVGACVRARLTMTFIAAKRGLFTGAGPSVCGECFLAELGAEAVLAASGDRFLAGHVRMLPGAGALALPPRDPASHKGDHGHLLVVGGDHGMGGAVAMAGEAALRAGAGRVSVFTRDAHRGPLLARRPELMVRTEPAALDRLLEQVDTVVVGPGLGTGDWSGTTLARVGAALAQRGLPSVWDADALNLLAAGAIEHVLSTAVITPHSGEAGRLVGGRSDRFETLAALRTRFPGAVVVLKGAGTLIGSDAGIDLCGWGNPGLAVGGSGDVLAGIIGALLAQGAAPLQAARLGVVAHAQAADELADGAGPRGLLPTDLLVPVRRLLNAS